MYGEFMVSIYIRITLFVLNREFNIPLKQFSLGTCMTNIDANMIFWCLFFRPKFICNIISLDYFRLTMTRRWPNWISWPSRGPRNKNYAQSTGRLHRGHHTAGPEAADTPTSCKNDWRKVKSTSTPVTTKWPSRSQLASARSKPDGVPWPFRCWQVRQPVTPSRPPIPYRPGSRPLSSRFTTLRALCMSPRIRHTSEEAQAWLQPQSHLHPVNPCPTRPSRSWPHECEDIKPKKMF